MILIVASDKDVASQNIAKQILNNYSFNSTKEIFQENPVYTAEIKGRNVKLVTLNTEPVYAQELTAFFTDVELAVFVSRHSSISGTPTLSVHTPGNLGEAELGGFPRKVSVSPANAMRNALKTMAALREEMGLDYAVSYECTHHGPSLNVPTMFAELGSSPQQWSDLKAAEVVAHAAVKTVSTFGESPVKTALGVGGQHYNDKFTRMALENEIAFGHMIPKYALPYVDMEILRQCVANTLERVESTVLDWKGIKGEHKPKLIQMLTEVGLAIQRI